MFTPAVTTQFISNIERGVTPLPPAHVPTLAKALMVSEQELMGLLEREFTLKLSGRLGRADQPADGVAAPNGAPAENGALGPGHLVVAAPDYHFMRSLYDAYRQADSKTRQAFATVCESMLNVIQKGTSQS